MKFSKDEVSVMTREIPEFLFMLEKEHPDLRDVFEFFHCPNCKFYKTCRMKQEVDFCSNFRRLGCD